MLNSAGLTHPTSAPTHNQSEYSGAPDSQAERGAASFGPYTAERLDHIEGSFWQCIWSARRQLDNLRLTPEEYKSAGQGLIDRAAEILQVTQREEQTNLLNLQ